MILAQVFKTEEGVRKRCAFENQHSRTHHFRPMRFLDGSRDPETYSAFMENQGRYTWRIEKVKKVLR